MPFLDYPIELRKLINNHGPFARQGFGYEADLS
ncbi:Uncharacterised protein [Mycobacterium tuberculosis]|nr:Uncharacterised protein [Mycobacterium tuberculosis]